MIDVQHLAVGDLAVPYVDLGPRDARTVVTVPGLSDGLSPLTEPSARHALATLASRALPYRLLILSHPDPLPAQPSTRALARVVAQVIERLVAGPADVSGHSLGGMVAQHLAAERPDLVATLTLTATAARPDPQLAATVRRWADLVAAGEWRRFYLDGITSSFTGGEQLRRRLALRVLGAPAVPHRAARHLALSDAVLGHDATAAAPLIRARTLVLAGAQDHLVRPAAARALAELIPSARFEVLPGVAHGFAEQAPARTYAHVASLLGVDPRIPV